MNEANAAVTTVENARAGNLFTPEFMLRGASLLYTTTMFALVGRVLITLLIAQALGASALGIYTVGFVAVQALSMLATNGQDTGLIRFVSPAFKANDGATMRAMLHAALLLSSLFGVVITLGMLALFPFYLLSSNNGEMIWTVPWFALNILPEVWAGLLSSFGLACGRMSAKALPDRVIGTLVQLVLTFVAVRFGWGLWGVVFAFLMNNIITLIATVWFVRDLYPRHIRSAPLVATARRLFGYAWKLGLSNAANYVLLNAALFVLGYLAAAEAGVYAAASRLTFPGLLFLESFSQVFGPHAAAKLGDPSLEQDFRRVTRWMIVSSAPIFTLLFAFAATWMNLLGPDFAAGAPVLGLIALAQMVNILTGSASLLVGLSNRPGFKVVNTVLAWGANLVLVLVLAPQWGALGAAVAYFVAVLIVDTLEYSETRYSFRLTPWGRGIVKPAVIILGLGGIFAVLAYALHPALWAVLALASIFVVAYIALMWFVGLPVEDVAMLKLLARSLTRWRAQVA